MAYVVIPPLAIAIIGSAAVFWWLPRATTPLCPSCGRDTRATSARCPECGREAAAVE
jgi:tRNA(Ile2) C34 agmatinyltransferase TiaS